MTKQLILNYSAATSYEYLANRHKRPQQVISISYDFC